jgi:hypothetical protein
MKHAQKCASSCLKNFRPRYVRQSLLSSNKSLVLRDTKQTVISPWVEQRDPAGSALTYYWNKETNETTPLGSSKPLHWVEVADPAGSELTYWWNPETNSTTALGASRPPSSLAAYQQEQQLQAFQQQQMAYGPPQSLGSSMKTYFIMGIGMTMGISLIGALFR